MQRVDRCVICQEPGKNFSFAMCRDDAYEGGGENSEEITSSGCYTAKVAQEKKREHDAMMLEQAMRGGVMAEIRDE
jgi:hypothetical protein